MSKELNQQNWLEPDEVMKVFGKLLPTGSPEPMSGEDWLSFILKPQLSSSVPQEVQDLFEAARGALVYGYFYYRLYYLGLNELPRVAEAAAFHKCRAEGKPPQRGKKYDSFNDNLNWLVANGHIQQADAQWWTGIRHARNFASHPTSSGLITPAMAIQALERSAQGINALYPAQSS